MDDAAFLCTSELYRFFVWWQIGFSSFVRIFHAKPMKKKLRTRNYSVMLRSTEEEKINQSKWILCGNNQTKMDSKYFLPKTEIESKEEFARSLFDTKSYSVTNRNANASLTLLAPFTNLSFISHRSQEIVFFSKTITEPISQSLEIRNKNDLELCSELF